MAYKCERCGRRYGELSPLMICSFCKGRVFLKVRQEGLVRRYKLAPGDFTMHWRQAPPLEKVEEKVG